MSDKIFLYPLDEIVPRINNFFFRCKDSFYEHDCFELKTIRKNMVTKVYCEGSVYTKPLVFLFSVSFFDTKKMVEIVKAGLESFHKKVKTDIEVDESSVEKIREFIRSSNVIKVENINGSISLSTNGERLELFTTTIDQAAINLFIHSLSIFLALCEKTVHSDISGIKLNDYGFIENDSCHS